MKKILALTLCFALLAGVPVFAEKDTVEPITAMNGFEWGASIEDVKEGLIKNGTSESDIEITEGGRNLFARSQKVSSYKCSANYYFDEAGKLYFGIYTITDKHSSENKYIEDYEKLNTVYEEVYGECSSKREKWINDFYKNDAKHKALAVSKGDLKIISTWYGEDGSRVIHSLEGDNYKIGHFVYYVSADYYNKEQSTNTNGV